MSDPNPPRARRAHPLSTRTRRERGRPSRRPQGSFRLNPALNDFYKHDPRRARSREHDLGLRWRARDHSTYRAAWIEDTGELYSVRHGSPTEGGGVTVLARVDGGTLDHALHGWRAVCDSDEPGSYEWLQERARAVDAASPDFAERSSAAA
jgi:hypothetical protein